MIIFERDKPKNIIIWLVVFLLSSVIGYVIYLITRIVVMKKVSSLNKKDSEDTIFHGLVNKNMKDVALDTGSDLFAFNNLAYNSTVTNNNYYEIYNTYDRFISVLSDSLNSANNKIIFEVSDINLKYYEDIVNILIEKAKNGVKVFFVYDYLHGHRFLSSMKKAGVKVGRFSKYNTLGRIYSNRRNIITIDSKIAFLGNFNVKKYHLFGENIVANTFMKLKGNVVQDIDLNAHQDTVFARGKFVDYVPACIDNYNNNVELQYVANTVNTDIELLLIKAICSAKTSIQLQLCEFVPTESIMSLLKFAINSNIDVKLMIPMKSNRHSKYYASRAYAKELAMVGANVYLYDGYIQFNAITIDSEYALFGSFSFDREHISLSLQNILTIKDSKAINYFNKIFETGIVNSYRINNAKYMLLREKFFKNFV
ncbi:MAG: hypothetical protein IKA36_05450 [Clostridia bacterium]|nr:hypothetical protein [Clostridia bacterium]